MEQNSNKAAHHLETALVPKAKPSATTALGLGLPDTPPRACLSGFAPTELSPSLVYLRQAWSQSLSSDGPTLHLPLARCLHEAGTPYIFAYLLINAWRNAWGFWGFSGGSRRQSKTDSFDLVSKA